MIVPTLTMLGRSEWPWSREAGIVVEAVATVAIMSRAVDNGHPDPLVVTAFSVRSVRGLSSLTWSRP
jgi:hypothetical protein